MNLREERMKAELVAATEKAKTLEDNAKKSIERPIPIERFASLQNCARPVLDDVIYDQVMAGIAAIKHSDTWIKWGFPSANSVLLFTGPSGTGKTTTARWIAKHLRKPLITVSMGDIGGGNPGDTERNLGRIFTVGNEESAVLFFDECDALLWDRSKAGEDSMWMVGVINFILTQIEVFNGIIVLASNFAHILDAALRRRVTYEVVFTEPSYDSRKKLWSFKWPKWPLALPLNEIGNLANANLTGAEIEKAIEDEARQAIIQGRKPTLASLKRIVAEHDTRKNTNKK